MKRKIYILLPAHNRKKVTERFINCLALQTYTNFHLVLIDDGSTDNTDQMVQAKIKHLTVIKGQGDWWWAGSLQQGINWLKQSGVEDQDIVMFANDDITFEVDFFDKAVSILNNLESALLLPQVIDEETGMPQESGVEADLIKLTFKPAPSPERINCMPTRGLFMRMGDLRKIGSFYPTLLPHYLSDYEFTIRAHRKGLRLTTRADLSIRFDREQTGYRSVENLSFINYIKQSFSKKSTFNPIFWSIFIILAAPLTRIPFHLFGLWVGFVKTMFQCRG